MRCFGAGALVVAVTWCSSGCRDNPGFALVTIDAPGETSTSTGDPPGTASTAEPGSSSSDGGATATSMVDPSTSEPPDPSTSTTAPPVQCGDGFMDPGEVCDDGNTTPGDGCEPGICRPLFVQGFTSKFGDFCATIATGVFDGDDVADLAIARTNGGTIDVLQNDGFGGFADQMPGFVFEIASTAIAVQDINHDDSDDIIALQGGGVVYYCMNDGDPSMGYCSTGDPIVPPGDPNFGTVVEGVLQVIDVTADSYSDILVVTDQGNVGYAAGIEPGVFDSMESIPLPPSIDAKPNGLALFHIVEQSQNLDLVVTYDKMGGQVGIVPNFLNNASLAGPFPVGNSAHAVAVAPLGLPGDLPEILVLDQLGKQLWVLSDGNQVYAVEQPAVQAGAFPTRLFPVALRGPGKLDIVVLDTASTDIPIAVVHQGQLVPVAYKQPSGLPMPLVGLTFADFDGDSDIDIAAIDGGCNLSIQINQTNI